MIRTHEDFLQPAVARNEILERLQKEPLRDLSVSRTNLRWGVEIPQVFIDSSARIGTNMYACTCIHTCFGLSKSCGHKYVYVCINTHAHTHTFIAMMMMVIPAGCWCAREACHVCVVRCAHKLPDGRCLAPKSGVCAVARAHVCA